MSGERELSARNISLGMIVAGMLVMAACSQLPSETSTAVIPLTPTVTTSPTPSPLPSWTPVPSPVPGGLYVDASQDLGPVNPLVYGSNYGPWIVVPAEMLPAAQAAHITYLRYPGGAFGDHNNLTHLDIDKFIAFARLMGAEANICVRLLDGTPEQAVDLLQYTRAQGYNVRYWSIGNEPNLYATMDQRPDYDTQRFNAEWRAIAQAMKAVDPNIILIGPDVSQYTANPAYNPHDRAGRDWLREFLIANGDLVDIVSIHRYPFPTGVSAPPPTIDDLRRNSPEWDETIPYLRQVIRETAGRDLPVAVTEVNSNWNKAGGGEATPDSFYNAIWWADALGRMIRNGVDIVAQFNLVTTGNQGGWGLLARAEPRPTYYVYMLYQRFGSQRVYASFPEGYVSIYAARRAEDGALTLMVINRGAEAATPLLRLEGFTTDGAAETLLFDAGHPTVSEIAPSLIADGTTLELPPQSITLYILPGK